MAHDDHFRFPSQTPFGTGAQALALAAICRIIEISVAEAVGEVAPEPLRPINYKLM